MRGKINNLQGQTFGYLTVIEYTPRPKHISSKRYDVYWKCKCVCGKITIVKGSHLKCNNTKSCGCQKFSTYQDLRIAAIKSIFKSTKYNDGNLTLHDFDRLTQQNCFYCNALPSNFRKIYAKNKKFYEHKYSGLDRIDNNQSHNLNNVVPCCFICNSFKSDRKLYEFLLHIKKLCTVPNLLLVSDLCFVKNKLQNLNSKYITQICPHKSKSGANKLYDKISRIRQNAKQRSLVCELNNYQMAELLCGICAYCNTKADMDMPIFNGIDRIENTKGYAVDNCISCCKYCNFAKNNFTLNEFMNWVSRIKNNMIDISNLEDLRKNPKFVKITSAGFKESNAHDVIL